MAGKKNPRSSKTDHVLSLLTESAPEPAVTNTPSVSASDAPASPTPPAAAEPVVERHLAPPILEVARTNNEALEETIHSALEDAFQEELAQEEAAAASAVPTQPEAPDSEPAPHGNAAAVEETSAAEAPATQEETSAHASPMEQEEMLIPSPTPAPVDTSEPFPYYRSLPDGARFVNVMLPLVEETLERYVTLFHLCDCPRCLADAQALALSRLPAKYVVLSESAFTPMMSLYRAKYDSIVTTQVVYACKQIMDAPRH